MRHQEHKVFQLHQARIHPPREEGSRTRWEARPVAHVNSVGVTGWVLPNVALIDERGLNDYVVARTAPPPGPTRRMAHDRAAPDGYVECFEPNVSVRDGKASVTSRRRLCDHRIVEHRNYKRGFWHVR